MPGRLHAAALFTASLLLLSGVHARERDFDLVIRGGRVLDGTGALPFLADVGVRDGRVAAVGPGLPTGALEVDAHGLVTAPGFIDVHSHAENVLELPHAENYVRMGVTSLVIGNCGSSVPDVGAFFRRLEAAAPSVNVATLVGHNTMRSAAMGGSFDRPPTPRELAAMRDAVRRAMGEGAAGLSTGLIYLPGTFARTEEIVHLAREAGRHGGLYASHMRSEGTGILSALEELFRVAREADVPAQVSHLKLAGPRMWGRAGEVLAALDRARAGGLRITHDQYVYTASSTGIAMLVPAAAREGGPEAFRGRLADAGWRRRIAAEMTASLRESGREDYSYTVVAGDPEQPSLNGLTVPQVAERLSGSRSLGAQIDAVLQLALHGAGGVFHGISEEDLQAFLRHPLTMVAADAGVARPGAGLPHPRGYGNSARLLARYVRELGVLRLPDAVRRMTSLPAAVFSLEGRGRVRPGYHADLVLFDPEAVRDEATYTAPHRCAAGIRDVFVNGVAVVRNGEHTGAGPGVPLRRRTPAGEGLLPGAAAPAGPVPSARYNSR